jgi:hypothetical protein
MVQLANPLTLINWIIRFLSYKEKKRAALFKDFIEPLFADLQTAYMEYVKALTEINATLQSDISLSDLTRRAHQLRAETAVLRHKCAAIADSYGQCLTGRSPAIDDFLAGAPSLFSCVFEGSYFFHLIDLIQRLASQARFQSGDEQRERAILADVIQQMLDTGANKWRDICGEYGRLRTIYCRPISMFAGQGKLYAQARLERQQLSALDGSRSPLMGTGKDMTTTPDSTDNDLSGTFW